MGLTAEQEGIQAQQRKKWASFWMLLEPLHLLLHHSIPLSSGRLMVSVAIQHVS